MEKLIPKYQCQEHGRTETRCGCPADAKREGSGELKVHEYLVMASTDTWYHGGTSPAVIEELEKARIFHKRVRLWLGDPETGKNWHEENDVIGSIGRSMGPIRIPLLIATSRSMGGGGISTDCIMRLMVNGREVYRHPKYVEAVYTMEDSDLPEYATNVKIDGELHARFKTREKAERWVAFMKGERMGK